jgi:hypothetical protein
MAQARYLAVTIPNGTAVSAGFSLMMGEQIVAIETPAAWTAADVAVQVSRDGTNFVNLFDSAGAANANAVAKVTTGAGELHFLGTVGASGGIMLYAVVGPLVFRLQSQTVGALTTVNQGADRICQVLITRF